MRLVPAILLCACGRLGFEPAAREVDAKGSVDCWSHWLAGEPTFSSIAPLAGFTLPDKQGNPWLTADGRTLYFDSGTGDTEVFRTTRANPSEPFGPPEQLTELTSPFEETGLVLTGNDLVGAFASSRAGSQGFDLWQVERTNSEDPFGLPTQAPYAAINNGGNQFDAFLTSDGLRLYYSSSAPAAPSQELRFATRSSLNTAFDPSIALPGAATFSVEADPDLSPDERVIVFAANSPLQLHVATRPSAATPFGTPIPLSELASTGHDGDPAFSANGCELFWVSDRSGLARDLYRATIAP